jgi:hypothetical protein
MRNDEEIGPQVSEKVPCGYTVEDIAVRNGAQNPMLVVVSRTRGIEKKVASGHRVSNPDDWQNTAI